MSRLAKTGGATAITASDPRAGHPNPDGTNPTKGPSERAWWKGDQRDHDESPSTSTPAKWTGALTGVPPATSHARPLSRRTQVPDSAPMGLHQLDPPRRGATTPGSRDCVTGSGVCLVAVDGSVASAPALGW